MAQYRKSIKLIDTCNDYPCNTAGVACLHKEVGKIYQRILKYYPETCIMTDTVRPTINFSEKDKKEIEETGFPYWCLLERSK